MDIQKIREDRKKPSVIFMKFCQSKDLHKKALFCFYEGEDIKYYGNRIEQITGRCSDSIVSYHCGGKIGVLKVKELIENKNQYDDVKTAYFIDRDFFPQEGLQKNVYQTSGYSVENYYTSSTAFAKVLNYAFGISCDSSDFSRCLDDYNKSMDVFHKHILVLNAWIKAQRIYELKSGIRKLELSNFKISKYFDTLAIDKVDAKQTIDKEFLQGIFLDSCIVENDEIEKYVCELKQTNMQQTLRGKFELEFLKKIIDDLKNKHKKQFDIKRKDGLKAEGYFSEKHECIKIDPNVDTLLLLSQCADTPEGLLIFLKQYSIDNAA